jgi:uncharacterized membrane protein
MGRIKGVVLFQFTVPILIWAGLKPGLGGLGIIRLAIRSASWRHSQYFHSLLLKRSQYGSGITECRSISSDPSQILEALFLYILRGRFTDDLRGENRMVNTETFLCQVCREPKKQDEVVPSQSVPEPIAELIRKEYPSWSSGGFICRTDLDRFRAQYVGEVLEKEKSELALLEEAVQQTMQDHELLAKNINIEFERQLSFGERLSDRIADFAGSWIFIISFTGVMFLWIVVNTFLIATRPFDPYPYILLNLVLSAVAAIQAPVIIMSQNRQESRDRLNAELDYRVNLNTEMEIHQLHKKIDHLLFNQGQRVLEIQKIQVELMENLIRKTS